MLSGTESQFLTACEREHASLMRIIELAVRNEELKARNIELKEKHDWERYARRLAEKLSDARKLQIKVAVV